MSTPQIIPGQQFGKWTVLRETEALYGGRLRPLWDCQCVCGTVRGIASDALVGGKSKQCRTCGNRANAAMKPRLTHGQSDTRLHNIWILMRRRCGDAGSRDFHRYGGRGISVCAEWGDFAPFYAWALSNGYESGLTLDRVDNDKGYSPDNCRWATRTTQNRNRRDNIRYNWKGALLTLAEIAEAEGVKLTMLRQRVERRKWPLSPAVTLPAGTHIKGAPSCS